VQQRAENREKIISAFAEIPLLFREAVDARRAFPHDHSLLVEIQSMYQALLQDIPSLINLLLHKHGRLCELEQVSTVYSTLK